MDGSSQATACRFGRIVSQHQDLVIFLPGIAGSVLLKEGKPIWGASFGAVTSALLRNGLDRLIVGRETGEQDLGDGIVASSVLDDVHLIPGLWKIEAYGGFCKELCLTVGLTPGSNFFAFPYDWRRDNRVSARRLAAFAEQKLHEWRTASGFADARIILIAHSMGGLVSRYFVECLDGWRTVRRLITLGTPHLGSLNALGFLANGYSRGIGPLPVDATAPLRSFQSVYQLLPVYRCIDRGGTELARLADESVPNLDPTRVADAAAFHAEIEQAETANKVQTDYPAGYLTSCISDRQPTFQSARVLGSGVELLQTRDGADEGGDGTVPAVAAIPFGADPTAAMHVWGVHSSLTNQEAVRESLRGALRTGNVDRDRLRSTSSGPTVALDLDDVYSADRMFDISANVRGGAEQTLAAVATPLSGGSPVTAVMQRDGDHFRGPLNLTAGAWRIRVAGRKAAAAEDVVMVVDCSAQGESR